MSTSRTEPADRGPRWAHYYLVHGLSIDDAATRVAEVTGLTLGQRESSFVGRYFQYRDSEWALELQVKLNWMEDGELIRPSFPEGVFVYYSSFVEDQLANELGTIHELEFYNKKQF